MKCYVVYESVGSIQWCRADLDEIAIGGAVIWTIFGKSEEWQWYCKGNAQGRKTKILRTVALLATILRIRFAVYNALDAA